LIDNPRISELPLRIRFKKLIHEPWKALQESHPQYIATPPVIILRWHSKRHNEEIFHSLCELSSSSSSSSLVWIISIDPRIKLPVEDLLDPLVPFRYIRPSFCYLGARLDTISILFYQFHALRFLHPEVLDHGRIWPSAVQFLQLTKIISGVFEFIDVIFQFVHWKGDGGPRAHLETFLAYMVDSPLPSDDQPYCALDHFYTHALSNIPPDLLLVVKKALSIICCLGHPNHETLDAIEITCLLSLENDAFFPHLQRLATIGTGKPYNHNSCTCFSHFLTDPNRSGRFYTPKSEFRLHAFQAYLHILTHSSNITTLLKLRATEWIGSYLQAYIKRIVGLRTFSCWKLCGIRDVGLEWTLLRRFDFRCLAHTCDQIYLDSFVLFLKRLYRVS
jgi:hypothetical protein